MRFGSPLWLLLLIPIAARWVIALLDRRRREGSFTFSSLGLIDGGGSWRSGTSWMPLLLESIALALLVIALARPQEIHPMAQDRRGIDVVIALDASGSMAAEDFQPQNRFEVAKEMIGEFIDLRNDDRIGIVTFGQRAATRVPVTFDRRVAREVLAGVEVGENGDGTAIGTAIATAVNRLSRSPARSRVIVLLTDGVNNSGSIEPPAAAELARELGIRLYAIGVGSYGPVPVPIRMQSRITGEIEIVYQTIRADLDDAMLTSIAERTGGEYFRATDEQALADILRTIDRLEKSRLAAPPELLAEELYRVPLILGLSILVIALLTGETIWMRLAA
ncbi:MAG TPA: VWA domain-containing protein [Thermoanaerobaculia bacterium]|nr:VWA domain-containing protein [Thermoanaerobaculia bacterium]